MNLICEKVNGGGQVTFTYFPERNSVQYLDVTGELLDEQTLTIRPHDLSTNSVNQAKWPWVAVDVESGVIAYFRAWPMTGGRNEAIPTPPLPPIVLTHSVLTGVAV